MPNARGLVQSYRQLPDNRLEASYNPRAIRGLLDSRSLPVWGKERPQVVVWLAINEGGGERYVIGMKGPVPGRLKSNFAPTADGSDGDQDEELTVADPELLAGEMKALGASRGLPLQLPELDEEDQRVLAFSDIWNRRTAPLMLASQRYRGEAVLIGRDHQQMSLPN